MPGYILQVNGVRHLVTFNKDGQKCYDPPLEDPPQEKMEELLVSRAFPAINSDTTFLAGRGTLEQQFDGDIQSLNETVAAARAHGYNPKPTDVYQANMARFPGDPEAFLSAGDGKGTIRKIYEKRGWSCEGAVKVKGRQPEKDPYENPKVDLGEDIVRDEAKKYRAKGFKGDDRELRDHIVEKHTRHRKS